MDPSTWKISAAPSGGKARQGKDCQKIEERAIDVVLQLCDVLVTGTISLGLDLGPGSCNNSRRHVISLFTEVDDFTGQNTFSFHHLAVIGQNRTMELSGYPGLSAPLVFELSHRDEEKKKFDAGFPRSSLLYFPDF